MIAVMATGIRGKAAGRQRDPNFLEEHLALKGWGDSANAELAKRTGRDRVTIWKWRKLANGPRGLSGARLAELAAALDPDDPPDLTRPPGRPSLDAMLDDAPDSIRADIYQYALGKLVAVKK